MTTIKENLQDITDQIQDAVAACSRPPGSVRLIAVSKKKSARKIMECIDAGNRDFGENYIQEAIEKIDRIGREKACWHFIGHLQSNKAKFAVRYFDYIHTVDSVKLAKEIDKQAKKIDKIQRVFLQVNIGREDTKSGTDIETAAELAAEIKGFENISVRGLMCMPPYFSDPELARPYFKKLAAVQQNIEGRLMDTIDLRHLSMGMSNDFRVAIEEGATMVRVGTSIFGSRD